MTIETYQSGNGQPEPSGVETPAWAFAHFSCLLLLCKSCDSSTPEPGQEMKEQGVKTLLFR
jgi:hypothetical protein